VKAKVIFSQDSRVFRNTKYILPETKLERHVGIRQQNYLIIQYFIVGYFLGFLAGRYSGDQIEDDELLGHLSRTMGRRDTYRGLMGKY